MGVTGSGFGNYGIVVAIKDKTGHLHVYAHLDSASVVVGQYVAIGQELGKQGTTGQSTGSHLHYEVRRMYQPNYGYGTHVDPTQYLIDYLSKGEAKMIEDLMKKVELLQKQVAALENSIKMPEVPKFAQKVVDQLVKERVLHEPNGRSYDLYSILAVLDRKGVI